MIYAHNCQMDTVFFVMPVGFVQYFALIQKFNSLKSAEIALTMLYTPAKHFV